MGREALPEVRDGTGGLPKAQGHVWRPSRRFGLVGRPSRSSGTGREVIPEVRDWSSANQEICMALLEVQEVLP